MSHLTIPPHDSMVYVTWGGKAFAAKMLYRRRRGGGLKYVVEFLTEDGTWASIIFQIAGINKPLLSVSKLISDGWRVVFDDDECSMTHKVSKKHIKIKRERGVFVIDAYVNNPDQVFTRQA